MSGSPNGRERVTRKAHPDRRHDRPARPRRSRPFPGPTPRFQRWARAGATRPPPFPRARARPQGKLPMCSATRGAARAPAPAKPPMWVRFPTAPTSRSTLVPATRGTPTSGRAAPTPDGAQPAPSHAMLQASAADLFQALVIDGRDMDAPGRVSSARAPRVTQLDSRAPGVSLQFPRHGSVGNLLRRRGCEHPSGICALPSRHGARIARPGSRSSRDYRNRVNQAMTSWRPAGVSSWPTS
jgi:hypothetical protein